MAKTPTQRSLVASAATNTTTRATIDCRSSDGGALRMQVTNGATGPTTQCWMRVYESFDDAAAQAAAAPGSGEDAWKLVLEIPCGVVANSVTWLKHSWGQAVNQIMVEFSGASGTPPTIEAVGSTFVG